MGQAGEVRSKCKKGRSTQHYAKLKASGEVLTGDGEAGGGPWAVGHSRHYTQRGYMHS